MISKKKNLLVIKHGALGDFILSLGPFKAIRNNHPKEHIALLTSSNFKEFAPICNNKTATGGARSAPVGAPSLFLWHICGMWVTPPPD